MITKNVRQIHPGMNVIPEGIQNVARNVEHRMVDLAIDLSKNPSEPHSEELACKVNDAMQNARFNLEKIHIELLCEACGRSSMIRSFINSAPKAEGEKPSLNIALNFINGLSDDDLTPVFAWEVALDEKGIAARCEFMDINGKRTALTPR